MDGFEEGSRPKARASGRECRRDREEMEAEEPPLYLPTIFHRHRTRAGERKQHRVSEWAGSDLEALVESFCLSASGLASLDPLFRDGLRWRLQKHEERHVNSRRAQR